MYMKYSASLFCFALALSAGAAAAQPAPPDGVLRVVRPHIHANADNAELCVEFDRALAPLSTAASASAVHLSLNGKKVPTPNLVTANGSLCLFPLERGRPYRLSVDGIRGAKGERLAAAYSLDFSIPDRAPSLAFSGQANGEGFAAARTPLTLRVVNLPRATLEIYRVEAPDAINAAWQDRAQAAIAPLESAYLARTRGQLVKTEDLTFASPRNSVQTLSISLTERLPDLRPGLYLAVVGTETSPTKKPDGKGLAPLAAVWVMKSDLAAQALRDGDDLRVFASSGANAKAQIRVTAFDRQARQIGEAVTAENGQALLRLKEKSDSPTVIVATDADGQVALADIENLNRTTPQADGGILRSDALFPAPGETVTITAALAKGTDHGTGGRLRLERDGSTFADLDVPPLADGTASLSFAAPAQSGLWTMRWIARNGALIAEAPLRVTAHADAPHLTLSADDQSLSDNLETTVAVRSLASGGKPVPLTLGRLMAVWQKSDPASRGWKDYRFGLDTQPLALAADIADFITDEQGGAKLAVKLPPPPSEPGLYEAVLTTRTDPDLGVGEAVPVSLPFYGNTPTIGIKPVAAQARFAQNAAARFALIALTPNGKPRDMGGLSYQLYEEGRSFAWYQHDGRWQYRREPQLRPIVGGDVSVRADGSSTLDLPVTAGNYRLEILDANGKPLTQIAFSAGWSDKTAARETDLPLAAPAVITPGRETAVRFTLPADAMIVATVSDGTLRKTLHERRAKGDNTLSFTATEAWGSPIDITVRATAENGVALRGHIVTAPHQERGAAAQPTAALTPSFATPPESLPLRVGNSATLPLDVENRGDAAEAARYSFAATPGLKIDPATGLLPVEARASRGLPVTLRAESVGVKDLHLELSGDRAPKQTRTWRIAVLPDFDGLTGGDTVTLSQAQTLSDIKPPSTDDKTVAIIARKPMAGFGEIAGSLLTSAPFTTRELAAGITTLRTWGGVLAQTGLAPDHFIAARHDAWLAQLLKRQNADGGFGRMRGEDSAIADTAAAVTGLAAEESPTAQPAREKAVAWLRQKLSNTWFDENEREARAAIYAALAAARAQDVPSLHYFSDTSLNARLSPEAQASLAAAFKQIRAFDAAAFWVKKLLAEKGGGYSPALLGALSATDALSSDETRKAAAAMAAAIAAGQTPDFVDAASVLRALAADNDNADKAHIILDGKERGFHDAWAIRADDPAFAKLSNADPQPLYVTFAKETVRPAKRAAVTRRLYRLNGVELSPQTKPSRGETYMVELTGDVPPLDNDAQLLIHDQSDTDLRPLGCALSPKLHTLSFIPWFSTNDLTPVTTCETTAFALDAALQPAPDSKTFRMVYFARLEGKAAADFLPAAARIVK